MAAADAADDSGDDWFGSCMTEGTHMSVGSAEKLSAAPGLTCCLAVPLAKEFIAHFPEEERELDRGTP